MSGEVRLQAKAHLKVMFQQANGNVGKVLRVNGEGQHNSLFKTGIFENEMEHCL